MTKEKRNIVLKYGEETRQMNTLVPKSKYGEIRLRFNEVLLEYINPSMVEIEVEKKERERVPDWKKKLAKQSFDIDPIQYENESNGLKQVNYGSEVISHKEWVPDLVIPAVKKKVDMDALRSIASGNVSSGSEPMFSVNKKPLDERFEFEYVTSGIPAIEFRQQLDVKGLCFCDRDDSSVRFVSWEGRILRFEKESEYNRFVSEFNIKQK